MSDLLRTLIGYHAWANDDLFAKLESLDATAQKAELDAALRLVDHAYVVARIFAAHLVGQHHHYASDSTEDTPTLEVLRAAVSASDRWYADYVAKASCEEMSEAVPFTFTDGNKGCMSREEMVTHVVLHAGYHRGEVGRILGQVSIVPPWDTFAVFLHRTQPARRTHEQRESSAA